MPHPQPYRILAQRDGRIDSRFLVCLGATQADATARVPVALADLTDTELRAIDFLWLEAWTAQGWEYVADVQKPQRAKSA